MIKKLVHIGCPHKNEMEGEEFIDGMKLWLIPPEKNDFAFEYLRFREDSWLAEEVQTLPHVACEVDSIAATLAQCDKVLHEEIVIDESLTIAFAMKDGVCLELMEYK